MADVSISSRARARLRSLPKTQCSACGRYFGKTEEFDAHRVGEYGLAAGDPLGRRCLSVDQMVASDWVVEKAKVARSGAQEVWWTSLGWELRGHAPRIASRLRGMASA